MKLKRILLQAGIKGYRFIQRQFNAASVGVQGLVFNQEREILLVEHTYCDGWYFPGGGVKSGESPETALIRELEEETGVIASEIELFGVYHQPMRGIDDFPVVFIVKKFSTQPIQLPNLEIQRMGWFKLDQLPENTTPATRLRLKEFLEGKPKAPSWSPPSQSN